jgi:hypothetical protein
MLMNEAFVFPDFKATAQVRHDVQPMGGGNRCLIIVMHDVMRGVDVVAVIEEMNAVARHCFR